MTIQYERAPSRPARPTAAPPTTGERPVYTRYCAAPRPAHPIGEPRYLHALLVAAWLGRLIDPLPHVPTKGQPARGLRVP
ncbi:MAG: hypothetical protein SNJ69_01800 [Chloroflexaceae bacterium]